MGKIYFIADTKIGEESMTTAPLYVITDDNNNRLFADILEITDVKAFEKHPDREKFITTVFPMVEDYFADIGKIGCTVISAVDKNTHIFQWGIRIERTDDKHISTSLIDWKATDKKISHYKQYKVTNNVTNGAYTQWIEGFVRTVIQDADIECKELVIDDIEESIASTAIRTPLPSSMAMIFWYASSGMEAFDILHSINRKLHYDDFL